MSMTNIAERLVKLEKAKPAVAPRRVIRLVGLQRIARSLEAAISHWCKDPDEPAPTDNDLIIPRSIVPPAGSRGQWRHADMSVIFPTEPTSKGSTEAATGRLEDMSDTQLLRINRPRRS